MQNKEQTVRKLEVTIEHAQEAVDVMDALLRLQGNADFNTVINTGYFEKFAINLVDNLADAQLQAPVQQEAIGHSMRGISELRSYFRTIIQMGRGMQKTINEANVEIDTIDDYDEIDENDLVGSE